MIWNHGDACHLANALRLDRLVASQRAGRQPRPETAPAGSPYFFPEEISNMKGVSAQVASKEGKQREHNVRREK